MATMKTIIVTRNSDGTTVARVSVDNSQDAHEYFCQQYDYTLYDYTVENAEQIPSYEFATH